MGRMYRLNPMCPYCFEEHFYWDVRLTDEEQAILDRHTEEQKDESDLVSLLSPPGLVIERKFYCGDCEKTFRARVAVRKEDEPI